MLPCVAESRPNVKWVFKCFTKLLYPRQDLVHPAKEFPRPQLFRRLVFFNAPRAHRKTDAVRALSICALGIWVED
jgi:hypothetical protein